MNKNIFKPLLCIVIIFLIVIINPVEATLPLNGKVIVLDAGHGGLDPGTVYKSIYEKDINLKIVMYLKKELEKYGASVLLTRNSDADLSGGVKNHRKKADFDNRIKIINSNDTDLYISIHLNYISEEKYYGAQVFYNKENFNLANIIQNYLNDNTNSNRKVKKIPANTYMYNKINKDGVLIECGFLSNKEEREKLITDNYQELLAKVISNAIVNYFK